MREYFILACFSRFKIDLDYVGEPPSIEVTIFHLNDNIDKQFLSDMVQKFGVIEELFIYYHPITNKHLGLGRVVYDTVKSAKACVEKLNQTSVMGKILDVFLDPFGEKVIFTFSFCFPFSIIISFFMKCKKRFEELTVEKKNEVPVVEAEIATDKNKSTDDRPYDPADNDFEDSDGFGKPKETVREIEDYDSGLKKVRDRDREKDRDRDRYSGGRSYRNDFATPSSADMGYGTAHSEFSATFSSAGTTPLG